MAIVSKENAEFALSIWQRIRGNALRRYAAYLIIAAIAAQSNLAQYLLTLAFASLGAKITIPETPYWFSGFVVAVAAVMLIVDRLRPEKVPTKDEQELRQLLQTGEDIIRRQRIMATTAEWRNDPSIGVREEEGNLWREAIRRHIKNKHPNNEKILKELEWTLDLDVHILDEKFNRAHGTRAGFIESYLNHSYRIMSFLKRHG